MTRYYQVPTTFSEWRYFARYTIADCAMVFSVTKRTVKNWESGKIEPPRAVFICLQLFSGRLDFLGKRWRGFRITTECIESPEGDFVRCEEIRALRYAMQAMDIKRDRRINNSQDVVLIDELAIMRKHKLSTNFVDNPVNETAKDIKQQRTRSD